MLVINISMTKMLSMFQYSSHCSNISFLFFYLPSCALLNSKDDAFIIFRDAAIYNMTDAGHVWIVTEQALLANNTPTGTIGLKLNNDNETEHIRVS